MADRNPYNGSVRNKPGIGEKKEAGKWIMIDRKTLVDQSIDYMLQHLEYLVPVHHRLQQSPDLGIK